ncbi:hypothetical protein [Kutzneria sp. 744]|uniref:hypothetical protein n=1 Tax=Kutzneria sp. (strain 744) TaxID=345341 RepID=UPI0003EEA66B|nr:hypothetical protein [Kutzneria sp. 744]EWM12987.1 hypothetical protein KUTG_03291 [Kutzneria sp. 744]
MSAYFTVGFGPGAESWNASRGLVSWVVEVLAEHVQDPRLEATLRELAAEQYWLVGFDKIEPEQAPDLTRAVLEDLMPAAEREFADQPDVVEMVTDLVKMVDDWQRSQNG